MLKTYKRVGKTNNFTDMNILRVNRGKVEILKSNGSYIRSIGKGDAVFADFNSDQTLIAITRANGYVEIYKENGSYIRSIGKNDTVQARWNGKEIVIQRKNGITELYKENGNYIRTI